MMNKPTAIIFDFDDTLIDSKPVIEKALEATFLEFNIPQDIITVKNIRIQKHIKSRLHIFEAQTGPIDRMGYCSCVALPRRSLTF